MFTDTIADFLTRIRNAVKAQHKHVDIPFSKHKAAISAILKDNGFIQNFEHLTDGGVQGFLRVYLRYFQGKSAIVEIKRISRSGLRVYKDCDNLPKVLDGLGISIISTSKGVMSDKQARQSRLGGEVICSVY